MAQDTYTLAFTALWNACPQARAKIRVNGRDIIEPALSSGHDLSKAEGDEGTYQMASVTSRHLLSLEANAKLKTQNGMRIELMIVSEGKTWVPYRVASRGERAGVVILGLETPHE